MTASPALLHPQPLNSEMKKQLEKVLQGFLEKNQVLKLDVKVYKTVCHELKLSGEWGGGGLQGGRI